MFATSTIAALIKIQPGVRLAPRASRATTRSRRTTYPCHGWKIAATSFNVSNGPCPENVSCAHTATSWSPDTIGLKSVTTSTVSTANALASTRE
jgi:hypothetical protein